MIPLDIMIASCLDVCIAVPGWLCDTGCPLTLTCLGKTFGLGYSFSLALMTDLKEMS